MIPYFALAAGFLTGKYRTEADLKKSPRGEGVGQSQRERPRPAPALDAVADRQRATPAQVALAWLMTEVTAPIASATSPKQLGDLAASARLKLDSSLIARLETARLDGSRSISVRALTRAQPN